MDKEKKTIKCVYCGKEISKKLGNETKDHVPPQCFYETPYPPNLITIPSCFDCNNNEYSILDETIKVFFLMRDDVNATQNFKGLVDSVIRAFNKGTPRCEKFYKEEIVTDKKGRKGFKMTEDKLKQLEKFVIRLIKGFHYYEYKKIVPKEISFQGFQDTTFDTLEFNSKHLFSNIYVALKDLPYKEASKAIKYRLKYYSDDQINHSIWHVRLFDVIGFYLILINTKYFDSQKTQPVII